MYKERYIVLTPEIVTSDEEQPAALPTKKVIKGYVPAIERAEHRAMYLFYQNLGRQRSLKRVADHFGKSTAFLANLSRAFEWQNRLLAFEQEIRDPVVTDTKEKGDDSGGKLGE